MTFNIKDCLMSMRKGGAVVVWYLDLQLPTYAISAYHHQCCEFESRSGRGV